MELDFSTPEKKFCCLKMKEVIQAKIYEETKDMSNAEVLTYFNIPKEKSMFKHIRND